MERMGRKARAWAGALMVVGATGLAAGASGCATAQAGKGVESSIERGSPEVVVVEDEEYIGDRDSIEDEDIDRIMENVYRTEGEATYELIEEGVVKDQNVASIDEDELYREVVEVSGEEGKDDEIELGWYGSMTPVADMKEGTGFLTAEHVTGLGEVIEYEEKKYRLVEKELFYRNDEGEKVALEYEVGNKEKDVALLRGEEDVEAFGTFADSGGVEAGDIVFHAGYPLDLDKTYTEGMVSNRSEGLYMITTMPVSPGDSGSPVYTLTEDGELRIVGIVSFSYLRGQLVNGVAKADEIVEMLERRQIDVQDRMLSDDGDAGGGR